MGIRNARSRFSERNIKPPKLAISLDAMAKLTTKARNRLPEGSFALLGRRYPIEDIIHARNALARVSQDGTPAEQVKVRRKVSRLYPELGVNSARQSSCD